MGKDNRSVGVDGGSVELIANMWYIDCGSVGVDGGSVVLTNEVLEFTVEVWEIIGKCGW